MKMPQLVARLFFEEDGPTAVEYAVMLALIMGAIIATVATFGGATGNMYGNISQDVDEIMGD